MRQHLCLTVMPLHWCILGHFIGLWWFDQGCEDTRSRLSLVRNCFISGLYLSLSEILQELKERRNGSFNRHTAALSTSLTCSYELSLNIVCLFWNFVWWIINEEQMTRRPILCFRRCFHRFWDLGDMNFIISFLLMERLFQTVCGKAMKREFPHKRDAHDPRIIIP